MYVSSKIAAFQGIEEAAPAEAEETDHNKDCFEQFAQHSALWNLMLN